MLLISNEWKDYKILDSGEGQKLENIGGFLVSRPDSQVIWNKQHTNLWNNLNAIYHRSKEGGGYWEYFKRPKDNFQIKYKDMSFYIEFTNFKHIGIFPEQSSNWDFIIEKISEAKSKQREVKVLNLFAYTGCATVASVFAGADEVVHVDASKKIVAHAKKNIELNNFQDKKVRFIIEDVIKFVLREIRRGRKYDCIIMDPPVYGRGPEGELWQIETSLVSLIAECMKLLSDKPILFLINCYTSSVSHISLKNILQTMIKTEGNIESGEIALPIENSNLTLPCGIYGRYYSN